MAQFGLGQGQSGVEMDGPLALELPVVWRACLIMLAQALDQFGLAGNIKRRRCTVFDTP